MPWTSADDQLLEQKIETLGRKWQTLAKFFPGRSGNHVRNHWQRKMKHIRKLDQDKHDVLEHGSSQNTALPPELEPEMQCDFALLLGDDDMESESFQFGSF
jgi:hypothetical protein